MKRYLLAALLPLLIAAPASAHTFIVASNSGQYFQATAPSPKAAKKAAMDRCTEEGAKGCKVFYESSEGGYGAVIETSKGEVFVVFSDTARMYSGAEAVRKCAGRNVRCRRMLEWFDPNNYMGNPGFDIQTSRDLDVYEGLKEEYQMFLSWPKRF